MPVAAARRAAGLSPCPCGVKGGTWFSLIDKMGAKKTLEVAWQQVRRNRGAGGIDGVSIERFAASAERNLAELESQIKGGRPRPPRR